jgi:hypothetical protein
MLYRRTLVAPGLLLLLAACGGDDSADSARLELPDSDAASRVIVAGADSDGDSYDSSVDCNDGDPSVHPGAAELDNLVDDDCDNYVDEDFVSVGDIIFTEINKYSYAGSATVNTNASWVEVYNTSSRTVDLAYWTFARGVSSGNQIRLDPATAPVIAPGDYAVLCQSTNYEGGAVAYPLGCDYVWGDPTQPSTYEGTYHSNKFFLRHNSDGVGLWINGTRTTGTEIDKVDWYLDAVNGYWPHQVRFSMSLDTAYYTSTLNDNIGAWCNTNENTSDVGVASSSWRWWDTSGTVRDEYGTPGAVGSDCQNDPDLDGDGYTGATDCDEGDTSVHPGATEVCGDGIDNDCDGAVDNGGGYADIDGDGYGDPASPGGCGGSGSYVVDNTDCDDSLSTIHPGATESDDGLDQDCDGWVDEDFVLEGDVVINEVNRRSTVGGVGVQNNASWVELYNTSSRTIDLDQWVFARGTAATDNQVMIDPAANLSLAPGGFLVLCDSDDYEASAGTAYPLACDYIWGDESQASTYVGDYHDNTLYLRRDTDTISLFVDGDRVSGREIDAVSYVAGWPNKSRFSMGLDPDFQNSSDNDSKTNWCVTNGTSSGLGSESDLWKWYDTSGTTHDEYGTPGADNFDCATDSDGDGYSSDTDCNDSNAAINPGATETCNGVDDDCDGSIDEGVGSSTFYRDADSDGYGNPSSTTTACAAPSGYVSDNTDCLDSDGTVNPGAAEVCGDGLDNDCVDDDVVCEFSGTQEIKAAYDFRAYGTAADMAVGSAVCNNGDYNGDGYDDVVVGQAYYDGTGVTDNGRVNLWYGPVDRSDDLTTANLTIDGDTSRNSDQFGGTTRFAGDVDNDGRDDLLSAAWRAQTDDRGIAYLFYGGNTSTSVSGADATFSITGATSYVGLAVDGAEATGDAQSDILVSAYGYSSGVGLVAFYDGSGVSGAEDLGSTATATITSATAGENLGYAVAMGDLDSDGMADFIIGAPSASSTTAKGSVYVFLGGGSMTGVNAATTADYTLTGSAAADRLGLSVAYLGDVDGDGQGDFAAGADKNDTSASDAGAVYVITAAPTGSTTALAAAETVFTGQVASDYFGRSVAGGGDENGDGYGEILIGATAWDYGTLSGAGAIYYFYGPFATGTVGAGTYDARFTGANTADAVGYVVSGGGDVNADGFADWLASATSWDGFGYYNSGGSWLYYGAVQ